MVGSCRGGVGIFGSGSFGLSDESYVADHVHRDAVAVAALLPLPSPNKCEVFH